MSVPITLNNVTSFVNDTTAATTVNSNSTAITSAFASALNTGGDTMVGTLNMNSNRVINLPSPLSAAEPLRLQDANTLIGGGTVQAMPAGGTSGQVLTKASNADYAVGWQGINLSGTLTAGSNITLTGTSPTTIATTSTPTFTSVNGNTITTGTGTLTLGAGKTLNSTNTLTLSGTDGTTMTFPSATDSIVGAAASQTLTNKTINGSTNTLNVRLGSDVSGNLPVTNLNNGSSATSSTFWRGDGTWAAVVSGTVGIPIVPQGRLTLSSGVPVLTSTVSGATSMIYTPYNGNIIPIYNGTSWTATAFSEISVLLTDTTKNPAAIGASKVNDWFVWNDGGTVRVSHGPDWTNDTTRSAGTALARINGVLTNNVAITNGPTTNQGTYVGTSRSNGSSTIDFIFGAASSGGTASFLGLWNMYNRINIGSTVTDTGAGYSYTATTIRQARASAGNQITFVMGLLEDSANLSIVCECNPSGTVNAFGAVGLGLDSITTYLIGRAIILTPAASAIVGTATQVYNWLPPAVGVHIVSANESANGTVACTFDSNSLNFLSARILM